MSEFHIKGLEDEPGWFHKPEHTSTHIRELYRRRYPTGRIMR